MRCRNELGLVRPVISDGRAGNPRALMVGTASGASGRLPAAGLALVGAAEERQRRLEENREIHPGRAMVDIPDVELDPLRPGDSGPAVDLSPARDPGLDLEPPPLAGGVGLDLVGKGRARPDEAHVPAQAVPELWELVDREPAQRSTDTSDPRIAAIHRPACAPALGADDHRAQLEQLELLPLEAHAPLPVEDRPA